jgi:hypothetical protein
MTGLVNGYCTEIHHKRIQEFFSYLVEELLALHQCLEASGYEHSSYKT